MVSFQGLNIKYYENSFDDEMRTRIKINLKQNKIKITFMYK